ncbi:MAG: endolytic transglycosylase MltG [Gammaproteobacteria bacterium]|nr:endolytic transglycosylase MltG [Gammaproteobacteria bacterium]
MGFWRRFFLSVLILILILIASFWLYFLHRPIVPKNAKPVKIDFLHGESLDHFTATLVRKKVSISPTMFKLLAYFNNVTHSVQAGRYILEPGITPEELLNKLEKGEVILRHFTIIPGQTFRRILHNLEVNKHLKHKLVHLTNQEIMQKLGYPNKNPEGLFAADTYLFNPGSADIRILQAAFDLENERLTKLWSDRAPNVIYDSKYEALIAASIIEKEANLSKERSIIADIIQRRLKKNMYLQLDPTVIYALGSKFSGDLSRKDLRINSPYNTYKIKGLPPAPICSPSLASIEAVMHPKANNYLYFVAKGDGSHKFSINLQGHDAGVKKYQLGKNND